ncbi:hypothetical protein SOVF_122540 [Spinacia oleracea]|nr:hypothetical protein SOVF_122540 [Spinacia oleracea]
MEMAPSKGRPRERGKKQTWAKKTYVPANVEVEVPSPSAPVHVATPANTAIDINANKDHNHAQCGITECSKLKDLKTAFLTDDATTICLEILEKGDLQVAGKEREAQLSLQFRDIATIVMENTINPDTKRPYSITMIERLMHDIHFAVDPYNSSKKQALDVIHRLVKKFPIKRSPMRLRLTVGEKNFSTILEKLGTWNGEIVTMDESGTQFSVVSSQISVAASHFLL